MKQTPESRSGVSLFFLKTKNILNSNILNSKETRPHQSTLGHNGNIKKINHHWLAEP